MTAFDPASCPIQFPDILSSPLPRVVDGDATAFRRVYDLQAPRLCATALRITHQKSFLGDGRVPAAPARCRIKRSRPGVRAAGAHRRADQLVPRHVAAAARAGGGNGAVSGQERRREGQPYPGRAGQPGRVRQHRPEGERAPVPPYRRQALSRRHAGRLRGHPPRARPQEDGRTQGCTPGRTPGRTPLPGQLWTPVDRPADSRRCVASVGNTFLDC